MPITQAIIEDQSQVSAARRSARQLAVEEGFDETGAERAAIVVTEAGTNLLKHATRGEILLSSADGVIDILVLDSGPGISDFGLCLTDGYSTAGTPGNGLGAIARLSTFCDVYSRAGTGTALLARLAAENGVQPGPAACSAVRVPKPGQFVCGDNWATTGVPGRRTFLLADGLGHGPEAARASTAATEILRTYPDLPPGELISMLHGALRSTRGAAIAVAEVDADRNIVRFAGLGNISAAIHADGRPSRSMVSINGTAGMEARHIREFTYPWLSDSILILHSDGIGTHWGLSDYPALASHDPAVIAGVLYRDHARRTDDATIVVAR